MKNTAEFYREPEDNEKQRKAVRFSEHEQTNFSSKNVKKSVLE